MDDEKAEDISIDIKKAQQLLSEGGVFIDIRKKEDRKLGYPKGSLSESAVDFSQIDKNQSILVICYLGNSSRFYTEKLRKQGFSKAYSIDGGADAWRKSKLPFELPKQEENNESSMLSPKESLKSTQKYNLIQSEKISIDEMTQEITSLSFMASVGEISSGIIHDIMQPLTVLDLYLEKVTGLLVKDAIENKEKYEKPLLKMSEVLSKTISISKNMKSILFNKSIKKGPINITQLKEDINFLYQFKSQIPLQWEIVGECQWQGLETSLFQIFLNLIYNAADFLEEIIEKEKKIIARVEVDQGTLIGQVINTGPRIPDDVKTQLGKTLFTTKEKGKGTGLGLSLIKKFIKDAKGDFFLDDSYDKTCFTFTLR